MRKIFTQAKVIAGQGHYLKRTIGLVQLFELPDRYLTVLKAFQGFLNESHKPDGLEQFMIETHEIILFVVAKLNPSPDEWQCLWWGIDSEVMKRHGITYNHGLQCQTNLDSARSNND